MQENHKMIDELVRHDGSHSPEKMFRDIAYALDQSAIVAITDRKGQYSMSMRYLQKYPNTVWKNLIGANHRIINSGYHPRAIFQRNVGDNRPGKNVAW